MSDPNEVDQLREQHPDWRISEHWVTVANGPDHYRLVATHEDASVSASNAGDLEREIRNTEVEYLACDVLRDKPSAVFTVRRVLRRFRSGQMSPSVALTQLRGVRS